MGILRPAGSLVTLKKPSQQLDTDHMGLETKVAHFVFRPCHIQIKPPPSACTADLEPVTPDRQGVPRRKHEHEQRAHHAHQFDFWAGPDSRPPPPPAGRRSLSATMFALLPGVGTWTLAECLPLAQGRASAAGACLPPACQRVRGNRAKQRQFPYRCLPETIKPSRPNALTL